MAGNSTGPEARRLAAAFPGCVGHLNGPGTDGGRWKPPRPEFPYALDNGAWQIHRAGLSEYPFEPFRRVVARAAAAPIAPLWVAVPDKVADPVATSAMWDAYAPGLLARGWPLAFVVQNGHRARDVPRAAGVVFVGGDTRWKWDTVAYWCEHFPHVHVGRVNSERALWHCHEAGARSVDGTGWTRGKRRQLDSLWYYLADATGRPADVPDGPTQPRLFPLRARCA